MKKEQQQINGNTLEVTRFKVVEVEAERNVKIPVSCSNKCYVCIPISVYRL